MILSHPHQFVFVRTTKTAGSSLEIALSKYCGPDDIVTPLTNQEERQKKELGYVGAQNHTVPLQEYNIRNIYNSIKGKRNIKFYNHMPAHEICGKISQGIWDAYFKFSIVRNPFDYAVSKYYWQNRKQTPSKEGFRRWLLASPPPPRLLINRAITHINGTSAVDFMVRFEHFDTDLKEVANRTGLPRALYEEFRKIGAKGGLRPKKATAKEMFDGFPEGVEYMIRLFAEDIRDYGYQVP